MARSKLRLQMKPKRVVKLTREEITSHMHVAVVFYRDEIKKLLNRGQPARTTAGGNIIGLDPSKPGEPPKKITGQLQNSIITEVRDDGHSVLGLVGTNLKKGPALELGKRDGSLKPRPYFRPALMSNRRKLRRILLKGLGAI